MNSQVIHATKARTMSIPTVSPALVIEGSLVREAQASHTRANTKIASPRTTKVKSIHRMAIEDSAEVLGGVATNFLVATEVGVPIALRAPLPKPLFGLRPQTPIDEFYASASHRMPNELHWTSRVTPDL